MKYDQKRLGENIRTLRKKKGLSLKTFEKVIGLTASYIGLIERGERRTRIDKLCEISEAFDVSLDALFEQEPNVGKSMMTVKEDSIQEQIMANLYGLYDEQLEIILGIVKLMRHYDGTNLKNSEKDNDFNYS